MTFVLFILCISFYTVAVNCLQSAPVFGDINLVVLTDSHSWVNGHKHPDKVPASDATYGDLISFVYHLKEAASVGGYDVFFMDNGDCVDGTGLSNSTPNDGDMLFPILKNMPFDALTIGNHELYSSGTIDALKSTEYIENWKGRYLTSNTMLSSNHEHLGSKYTVLRGKNKPNISILTFGFLYNMEDHCDDVIVAKVENTVKEDWFVKAVLNEEYNAIVVLAHMHFTDPLTNTILNAIRKLVGFIVPVQFITGHSHIRGFHQMDASASSFEAGKYFDTVGFISFNLSTNTKETEGSPADSSIIFHPVYIDANVNSFLNILHMNKASFDTTAGNDLDALIASTREALSLNEVIGCSNDYYDVRLVPSDAHSLWQLYLYEVVPSELFPLYASQPSHVQSDEKPLTNPSTNTNTNTIPILLQSTGSFRYDLYAGQWTVDDIWMISPFEDRFHVISGVPGVHVKALLERINNHKKTALDTSLRSPSVHTLPNYVSSSDSIVTDAVSTYDLFCVGFDSPHFLQTLRTITGILYTSIELDAHVTDTSVWFSWVSKNLPKNC